MLIARPSVFGRIVTVPEPALTVGVATKDNVSPTSVIDPPVDSSLLFCCKSVAQLSVVLPGADAMIVNEPEVVPIVEFASLTNTPLEPLPLPPVASIITLPPPVAAMRPPLSTFTPRLPTLAPVPPPFAVTWSSPLTVVIADPAPLTATPH